MSKWIETDIMIDAPISHVWQVLMDFSSYPEWNPFIVRIHGEARVGTTLHVSIQPPGKQAMEFKPEVLVADKDREFRWLGHLLIPGIFDGEHVFQLKECDDGTKFIQKENFRGLLSGLFMRMIGQNTRHGFEEMNQALKERVEQESGRI